ncbi:MAG TPA: hypothetical protein VMV45_05385 [Casimicrobiaceae bacterium]|nr:hypothetical protein [Casimicrobiaceae bacterium]
MQPLIVLLFLPCLIGLAARLTFRETSTALLLATLASPLVVYGCIVALNPNDSWNWLAALLVAPLVVAMALSTVLIGSGRRRTRQQRRWHHSTLHHSH